MNKQLIALFLFGLACGFQPLAVRTTVGVVSSNKRASVAMSLFGDNKQKEAEEKARIEAEQEALNARYAKESQNDLIAMSVFGLVTTLPVIYLLGLALTGDGGGGAGVY